MKKALIMGITGSFGRYVAESLAREGWQLRTLIRDPSRLPGRFKGIEIIQGDASVHEDVDRATDNIDLIIYAINPANYNWKKTALNWLNITAAIAEQKRLHIIFPGNVYSLNPASGTVFNEQSEMRPVSAKGKIRQAMEARLKKASQNGAKVLILRCGDFIGKNLPSTWMNFLISKPDKDIKLTIPGNPELTHTWAYLPDVADTVAELTSKIDELDSFEVFHFKGHRFSLNELATTMTQVTGMNVKMKKLPWFAIKVMGLFSTLYAGLYEMKYLWDVEISLDDSRLQKIIGRPINTTPLNEVLTESGFLTM